MLHQAGHPAWPLPVCKQRANAAGKLAACRYFFRYELPKTETQARLLGTVDDTALLIDEASF